MDIVSGLWRKDSGSHAELRKIAFTPAGLVVPSRDWLIGRADERVARGPEPESPGGGPGGPPGPGGGGSAGPAAAGVGASGVGTALGASRGQGSGHGAGSGHGLAAAAARPGGAGPGGGLRVPAQTRVGGGIGVASRAPSLAAARLERVERGPGQRVSGGDVAALRSVCELFRALDHAYGGGHARQALVRYLEHEAEPMLRGVYGEQLGRRLFAAAADLTRLAGAGRPTTSPRTDWRSATSCRRCG